MAQGTDAQASARPPSYPKLRAPFSLELRLSTCKRATLSFPKVAGSLTTERELGHASVTTHDVEFLTLFQVSASRHTQPILSRFSKCDAFLSAAHLFSVCEAVWDVRCPQQSKERDKTTERERGRFLLSWPLAALNKDLMGTPQLASELSKAVRVSGLFAPHLSNFASQHGEV